MNLSFNYENKVISYEQRLWNSYRKEGSENTVAVYGTDGMAQVGRWVGGHHAFRAFDSKGELIHYEQEPQPDFNFHARNFIDCIRTRELPNADIEIGHISTTLCHLGNIVARTKRTIQVDAKGEQIVGDEPANQYVRREYREHWSTPRNV
jgi:predicted dehydrogenase